jgi:hypothetical protein
MMLGLFFTFWTSDGRLSRSGPEQSNTKQV